MRELFVGLLYLVGGIGTVGIMVMGGFLSGAVRLVAVSPSAQIALNLANPELLLAFLLFVAIGLIGVGVSYVGFWKIVLEDSGTTLYDHGAPAYGQRTNPNWEYWSDPYDKSSSSDSKGMSDSEFQSQRARDNLRKEWSGSFDRGSPAKEYWAERRERAVEQEWRDRELRMQDYNERFAERDRERERKKFWGEDR